MKLSPDDPKLTAYALGELDRAEAAAIEREVNNSAELREAVQEIRATAEFLKSEFLTEEKLSLSEQQKQIIAAGLPPTNVIPMPKQKVAVIVTVSAIAACVMFVLAWGIKFGSTEKEAVHEATFKYALNAKEAQKEVQTVTTPRDESGTAAPPPAESTPLYSTTTASSAQEDLNRRQELSDRDPRYDFEDKTITATTGSAKSPENASETPALVTRNEVVIQPSLVGSVNGYAGNSDQWSKKQEPAQGDLYFKATTTSGKALAASTPQSASAGNYNYGLEPAKKFARVAPGRGTEAPRPRTSDWGSHKDWVFANPSSDTARYPQYVENAFESVRNAPLSTVSIDVDTASYANVRRFLNQGQLPPADAVRIEEMINYFSYSYPQPHGSDPFSVNMEVAGCPWNKHHHLVRVGLKGREMAHDKRPPSNFVFLIDVSGSMSPSERLPLIKQALRMLVKKMTENDRVAMVVYASSSGVVLESTSCVNKERILEAIDRLEAGGSTNGGQGIQKAYSLAEENFIKGGVNRVILATDGDFNVGITDQGQLIDLIQKKAKTGVFLSALGVGTDNYKDALLQKLADKGNGNYHYLDSVEEAEKVLIQQMNGTLVTIAKDVKIQIEFNPARVSSYRLIGYEKRVMEAQDFNNDKKDAGEIGAGHTVTALYEIVPVGVDEEEPRPAVDDLKYQSKQPRRLTPKSEVREPRSDDSDELLTLKLRYKKPDGDTSKLLEFPLNDGGQKFAHASSDFRFATAVAGFGMLLKNSEYRGILSYDQVYSMAQGAKGDDKEGYRSEFMNLVKKAKSLHGRE